MESCHCFPWFLKERSRGLVIPKPKGSYAYRIRGLYKLEELFSIQIGNDEDHQFTDVGYRLTCLYSILFLDFNNIPNCSNLEWFVFGFCYCTNGAQREALPSAYLQLAEKRIQLRAIASAWEACTLNSLMRSHGIDISFLESSGIEFQRPSVDDFPVYRFIAEVQHLSSGCYCHCFNRTVRQCKFRSKFEMHLSAESEGNYGFHGTNAWERWQILKLYSAVFAHPQFKPRDTQAARRDQDAAALERYLDKLLPNFQKQIFNKYLADAMFPKLRARMIIRNSQPDLTCEYIIHAALMPAGLNLSLVQSTLEVQEGDEDAQDEPRA